MFARHLDCNSTLKPGTPSVSTSTTPWGFLDGAEPVYRVNQNWPRAPTQSLKSAACFLRDGGVRQCGSDVLDGVPKGVAHENEDVKKTTNRRPAMKAQRGLTIVEYCVAAGLVIAVGAVAFSTLGDTASNVISSLVNMVTDNARSSGP